jgi:hypothetical protein
MNGRRFLVAVITVAVLVLGGAVLAACGAESEAGGAAASPASSPNPEAAQAVAPTAVALSRALATEKSWRYEPAGDVTDGRDGASRLVFAHLYRIRDEGGAPAAVFDAEQLYVGAPAEREAARDGETIQGATYRRNAHVHRQTLPLAEGCPIVAAWADQEVSGAWPDLPTSLPVRDTNYWLVIDGGEITAMVWQGY